MSLYTTVMDIKKFEYKPYDSIYSDLFENELIRLNKYLKFADIVHFGSSAVPGLGGKGIIDIFVVVSDSDVKAVHEILVSQCDYEFRPGGGDERRHFFRRYETDKNGVLRTFHLHLTDEKNPNYYSCIAFRDFLRNDSKAMKKYDDAKRLASTKAMKIKDPKEQQKVYQEMKAPIMDEIAKLMGN